MRRAKWGVGAAAVVAVAWFLSNFFNMNLGGVGGDGEGRIGLPTTSSTAHPDPERTEPPEQGEPATEPVFAQGEDEAIGTGGVVEVLIDDRNYSVHQGTGANGKWVAAEPGVIAGYARQATGDETGAKVRILRKPSARAAAEKDLVDALREAGLSGSEIDVPEGLVE